MIFERSKCDNNDGVLRSLSSNSHNVYLPSQWTSDLFFCREI